MKKIEEVIKFLEDEIEEGIRLSDSVEAQEFSTSSVWIKGKILGTVEHNKAILRFIREE